MNVPVDTGTGTERRSGAEAEAGGEVATADVLAFPGPRAETPVDGSTPEATGDASEAGAAPIPDAEAAVAAEAVADGGSHADVGAADAAAVDTENTPPPAAADLGAVPSEVAASEPAATEPVAAPIVVLAPPPPPTPGQRLRAARDARQLGFQQVTDSLHIDPRLIAAMEADDFAAFDAPVYARGFLRKYAAFLEVPADEILAAYERLHAGPVAPTHVPTASAEVPRRDWSALKLPAAVAVVVVLVGGSYWWWLSRSPDRTAPSAAPAVAAPVVATYPTAEAPATTGEGATGASRDAAAGPSTAGAAVAGAVPTPRAPAQAANPTFGPPSAKPSGSALEIEFVSDCWVDATGPTGTKLMYGLGVAGESRALPGPGPWRVTLGNVAGVRLRVSGRPVLVPAARRAGDTARLVVGADGAVQ